MQQLQDSSPNTFTPAPIMSMRFPGRAEGAICHFFAEGRCRSGPRCAFLHIVQTDGFAHSQMMPTLQDVQNFQNFQNFATGMPFAPGEFPPAGPGQPRSTPIVKKPAAPKRTEEANLVMTEEVDPYETTRKQPPTR